MGSLNIDYVYRVPHFVQPGETISSYGREIFAGGKGLNQSIALARAGAQVIHGGMIGPDGAFLKELLEDSGVDTTHICTLQEASGHTVIQVDEQGQNCIILYAGTNHCVTKAYLDELLKDASAGDFMLIQNEINCLNEAMEIAHKKKMYIAFNPSPISKALFTLPLSSVDWWFCNEIEGAILFGKNQKQKMADQIAMDPEKIMQQFQKQYPQSHLILTLGKKGSYYCDKKDILFQPAFEVKAIDTTAAGDTYSGYFLADLAGGKNISDALKIIIENTQPSPNAPQGTGFTNAGKNNKLVVKKLISVVLDDTEYEIACTMNYLKYLEEQIKRLKNIEHLITKMNSAKKQEDIDFYKDYIPGFFKNLLIILIKFFKSIMMLILLKRRLLMTYFLK